MVLSFDFTYHYTNLLGVAETPMTVCHPSDPLPFVKVDSVPFKGSSSKLTIIENPSTNTNLACSSLDCYLRFKNFVATYCIHQDGAIDVYLLIYYE